MVFEAHSTDYQTPESLRALVRDGFAILKVGPGVTFALREALYALADIEAELLPQPKRADLRAVVEAAMLRKPANWDKYYHGDARPKDVCFAPTATATGCGTTGLIRRSMQQRKGCCETSPAQRFQKTS